jgi:hypothetical protein
MKTYYPVFNGFLLLLAVLCFLLAVFHAHVADIDLTNLGLAFGFGSFLFPRVVP